MSGKIKIPTVEEIRSKKLNLKLDINLLELILSFLRKDSVLKTRKVLNNTKKLFEITDESVYKDNIELSSRVWLIKKYLDKLLDKDLTEDSIIYQEIKDDPEFNDFIDSIYKNNDIKNISYNNMKSIIKSIDDRLEYGYVMTIKDVYQGLLNAIDDNDFNSYKAVSNDLQDIALSVINIKRSTRNMESDTTFSLRPEVFENIVSDSLSKLKDKQKVFLTGIQALNVLLSPGYMGKRLYMYLAFPGGGKSQVLLKAALDIKRYNGHIKAKNPDNNPAVLLITMENDIDETIERMFNMLVDDEDIRNYNTSKVIKSLRTDGELTITNKNSMDIIIKYFPNRSISTDDLYTIIQDLEDDNIEVVALILDYVKRIRPTEKASSEKEELKNITNELKTLAKIKEIPVITAQQLNRTASSIVDAAVGANKEDVTRLVGRDGVAGSWEIIENSDVVIIINQEIKKDTNDLYLTFKLLKRRYKSTMSGKYKKLDYFNHPYAENSTIRLVDDIYEAKSKSLTSLSSQFIGTDEGKRGKSNVVERDVIDSKDLKKSKNKDEFDPFEF